MKSPYLITIIAITIPAVLAAQSTRAADEFFDSDGVKIRYVTAGKGQAVVLIHGWMADSSMWGRDSSGNTKLKTTDDEGFQAIAFDCRGHGRSDKPLQPEKYGVEMARDVVRLLDHLKIEKAHLVGYSSGAFIAGHVAATHPDRVLSVVYAGQAPVVTELIKPNDFAECETFAKAVEEDKGLGAYIQAVTPADRPKPNDTQANTIAQFMFAGKDVKAIALAGSSFKDLRVSGDQLRKCTAPTLFMRGENESEHVKGRVAAVRKLLDRGEVKIVAGGDHMTTLAKPEFADALREFLRTGRVK